MRRTPGHALAAALLAAVFLAGALLAAPAVRAQAPERIERGALILENVPVTPPAVRERLRQYSFTRGAAFLDFTPDGGMLISTRFGDAAQIHKVAAPLGARTQLTFYDDRVAGGDVRPGGSGGFIFLKDSGGDEYYQGWWSDPTNGRVRSFTEAGTRNLSMVWSRDGGRVAWSRATRESGDYDILVADPADPSSRRVVHEGTGALSVLDWSPKGDRLLLSQYISIAKSRLFLLEIGGGLTELTPDLDVSYSGGEFTADGRAVITTTDEGSEFSRLATIDLATGARTVLTPDLDWDVEGFDLSPDGRTLAYAVNAGGASQLRLMDVRNRRGLRAPDLPPGVIGGLGWDAAGRNLAITLNSAVSPSDVHVYSLRTRALTRWTASEIGGLDPARFAQPKLVRFPTFDSASGGPKEITAWVYEPATPGPHPVVIDIHGGPEGQSRPTFNSRIQHWVNELGIAVVLPNVRGSTGYGKTFVSLDNGTRRLDSVKDIGALLDWLAASPQRFDASRVAAYGGSYGGYMVYAAMVMFPDRFAAGVDIVGIGNLRTFLENTSGYRRDLRRPEYGDERDPAVRAWMEETAALNNVGRIRRPMFLIHGANDPRVPVSEAEAMVKALRAGGLDPWLMIARDEGHGFAKKPNQDAQREAEALFFEKTLGLKAAGD